MFEIEMPEGLYLSVTGRVRPGSGGQTRALLLRNRLLAQYSNVEPTLLTLDDDPNYPSFRETLTEQGHLTDSMRLLNLYEWYRNNDIDHLTPTGDELPPVPDGLTTTTVNHPDGTLYQTRYGLRHGGMVMTDYHRADGSVYLRVPAGSPATVSAVTKVYLVNSEGEPVGQWNSQRGWVKQWVIHLLEPERRAFLICDSRYAIADLLPLKDDRLHILHLIHNVHLRAPYQWSSPLSNTYVPLLSHIHDLDALVTLTGRQREDLIKRFGATDNLFVIPNPVTQLPRPDDAPVRRSNHFVMVARLEYQKRIEDGIRAFALVLQEEPDATLDIFGDGGLYTFLANEIETLGIGESVRLRGYHPDARTALWSATGMLLTSRFEGYPLATLEAFSHGCPVISYDMKYGPREQLSPGVDGFLLPEGDLQGVADSIVRLIRDPALAGRMSEAALVKAAMHDHRALLNGWREVIEKVIEQREERTSIKSVELEVLRLGYRRLHRLPDDLAKSRIFRRLDGHRSSSAGFRAAPLVEFIGRLKVVGRSKAAAAEDMVVTLEAVDDVSGAIVPIPLTVKQTGKKFRLTASFDPAEIFTTAGEDVEAVRLRLRLVWHNSSWQTDLARRRDFAPNYELSYTRTGELSLLRGPNETPSA